MFDFFSNLGKPSGRRMGRFHGRAVQQGRQVPGDPRLRGRCAGFPGRRRRPGRQGPAVAQADPAGRRHYPADGRAAGRRPGRPVAQVHEENDK